MIQFAWLILFKANIQHTPELERTIALISPSLQGFGAGSGRDNGADKHGCAAGAEFESHLPSKSLSRTPEHHGAQRLPTAEQRQLLRCFD